jgi:MFS family permease
VGGWLVEAASWRWVFLLNIPVAALVVWVSLRHMPESKDLESARSLDWPGAVLGVLALAALTYGLVAWGSAEGADGTAVGWLVAALGLTLGFLRAERRASAPMLPLGLFAAPLFRGVNLVTFAVYAALGGLFFMLVITLQLVAGFDAVAAGAALLPVTILMLVLSARAGQLAERIGPRVPMTVGPLLAAAGVALLVGVDADTSYLTDVLPGVLLFGLGLSATVAPLTSTVLAAAPLRHAGVASGVNNAVARSAGLLIVAALPALVGLDTRSYADPAVLLPAYVRSMWWCAGLLALGGILSALLVRADRAGTEPATGHARLDVPAGPCRTHCAVGAPPLQPGLEGSQPSR